MKIKHAAQSAPICGILNNNVREDPPLYVTPPLWSKPLSESCCNKRHRRSILVIVREDSKESQGLRQRNSAIAEHINPQSNLMNHPMDSIYLRLDEYGPIFSD